MTPLERAHEALRKEAISLRRENASLKAGTYTDKDRDEHEKEIRHLKREISDLTKAKERYHSYWRDTESLKGFFLLFQYDHMVQLCSLSYNL